jgi:hypothetical protein
LYALFSLVVSILDVKLTTRSILEGFKLRDSLNY